MLARVLLPLSLAALCAAPLACGRIGFGESDRRAGLGGDGALGGTSGLGSGSEADVDQAPCAEGCSRSGDGLLLLYEFNDDSRTIRDTSGFQEPVNLSIPADGDAHQADGRLVIEGHTLIVSEKAASKIASAVSQTDEVSMEAWVIPDDDLQFGPARVFTISADEHSRNLTLAQDGPTWHTRTRTSATDDNGTPSLATAPLATTRASHLVLTRDASGAEVFYVDGLPVTQEHRGGNLATWNSDHRIALGAELNATDGSREWLGKIELLAVYDRALGADEVKENFIADGGTLKVPCTNDCAQKYEDAFLFDDFEGELPSGTSSSGGRIDQSTDQAHSGSTSLRFVQEVPGGDAEAEVVEDFGRVSDAMLYARSWLYVPAGTVTSSVKFMAFNGESTVGTDIKLHPDGVISMFSQIDDFGVTTSAGAHPYDQWFCAQISVRVHDSVGDVYISVDGQQVLEHHQFNTAPSGAVERFVYGLAATSGGQTGGDFFMDDVVLSDEPIGCD